MARQSYGYAHWSRGEGLLCLRNAWIATDSTAIKLDAATLGNEEKFSGYAACQIYPYPACLATGLKSGDTLTLAMGPYQCRLIRLIKNNGYKISSDPVKGPCGGMKIRECHAKVTEVSYDDGGTAHLAAGATVLSPAKGFQWQSTIAGEGSDASSKLYYLVEASQQVIPVGAAITLNGRPATPVVIDSKQGWSAAAPNEEQLFWKWYVVALPAGPWETNATIELRDEHAQVSAWVIHDGALDTSAGGRPWSGSPAFPLQPDCRPQTSLAALPPSPLSDLPREKASRPAQLAASSAYSSTRCRPPACSRVGESSRRIKVRARRRF